MRSFLVVVLTICCAFVASVAAQANCSAYEPSCEACAAVPGCGYCPGTWECLNGTASGPYRGHCDSWRFGAADKCLKCGEYSASCTECVDHLDCGWVQANSTCVSASLAGADRHCPCELQEQCTDCVLHGCTFCTNTGKCQSEKDSTCVADETCDCALITDCTICNIQSDNCAFCERTQTCDIRESSNCPFFATTCATSTLDRASQEFNGPSFIGGIAVGLVAMALILGVVYLLCRRAANRSDKGSKQVNAETFSDKDVTLETRD